MRLTSVNSIAGAIVAWLIFQCALSNLIAQTENGAQGQVMLLKNGATMRGWIERNANHYSVHTDRGNRLDIPFENVEFIAETLSEMYWRRMSGLGMRDVAGHENLFFWCLDQSLKEESRNQLEILEALEVDENKIRAYQRRMDQTMQKRAHRNDRQMAASADPPVGTDALNPVPLSPKKAGQRLTPLLATEKSELEDIPLVASAIGSTGKDFFTQWEPIFRPLPLLDFEEVERLPLDQMAAMPEDAKLFDESRQIIQVGYEDNGTHNANISSAGLDDPNSEFSPGRSTHDELSARELETFIKRLPKNSLARFRNKAEPVLISHCSHCHQRGSQEVSSLQLMFRSKSQPLTVRMSERNLYAASQFLNPVEIEASSLLYSAITAHGTQTKPAIAKGSGEYVVLKDWVELVTGASGNLPNPEGEASAAWWKTSQALASEKNVSPLAVNDREPQKFVHPGNASEIQSIQNLAGTAKGLVPGGESEASEGSAAKSIQGQSGRSEFHQRSFPRGSASATSSAAEKVSNSSMLTPLPPTIGEIPSLKQTLKPFVPRDDFDPEIFNREFHRYEPR
jgi:hypothetical protein